LAGFEVTFIGRFWVTPEVLDGCLRLVFLQLVLNVMLTELPIRRWIPSEGLILVSVFPETLPIDFLPRIFVARPDIAHETK
jgi:hypothetical protein